MKTYQFGKAQPTPIIIARILFSVQTTIIGLGGVFRIFFALIEPQGSAVGIVTTSGTVSLIVGAVILAIGFCGVYLSFKLNPPSTYKIITVIIVEIAMFLMNILFGNGAGWAIIFLVIGLIIWYCMYIVLKKATSAANAAPIDPKRQTPPANAPSSGTKDTVTETEETAIEEVGASTSSSAAPTPSSNTLESVASSDTTPPQAEPTDPATAEGSEHPD